MTTTTPDAASLELDVTGRVRVAQVEGLHAKLPVAVLSSLPVGSAAAWSLWSANPHAWLLAWLGVMVGVVVIRLLQWRAYAAAGAARFQEPDRWARRSAMGSFVSGLVWSAGLLLFLPPAAVPDRLFVVVLLAGMLAGSAGTLSDHLPAFLAFGIPMALPITIVLAGSSNALERLLVPFSLVYFTVIT
jgi:hypothetical protein